MLGENTEGKKKYFLLQFYGDTNWLQNFIDATKHNTNAVGHGDLLEIIWHQVEISAMSIQLILHEFSNKPTEEVLNKGNFTHKVWLKQLSA